jgi:hypothetical protein
MRPSTAWKAIASLLGLLGLTSPSFAQQVDFDRDVLPILSAHCFACHGPDASKRKADLRLDVRSSAVADQGGPAAIVPGRPAESELIARITAKDERRRMPPVKTGPRLKPEQIQLLRTWIEQGAPYTEHWAFLPPRRPLVPRVQDGTWPQTPLDSFILHRLEQQNLRPAPPASREVLIRRATLDLLGLPPTPDEINAFRTDASPNAYQRLVERLLQSPQYGERWGRHWLDVARYADSGGFETDIFFASAWRYRDYVIRSINADKPFDQFIREQIAGDELYPKDRQALLATALYAIGPVLEEAGMVRGKLDYDWLTDAVDTTGSAFLGLTLGCARCHDHKYDPISQRDYFALQAVFAASDLFDFNANGTVLREHVALKKTEKDFEQARTRAARTKQPGEYDEYPDIPLRGLGHRSKPIEVRLLKRGELDHPGEPIQAGLPSQLVTDPLTLPSLPRGERETTKPGQKAKGKRQKEPSPPGGGEGRVRGGLASLPREAWRTALANWIGSDQNPLTARVLVNRLWQGHFGQGLVRTPNDFGTRGERPTHPELLDWLAAELVEHGWSLKHVHRLILLSSTYQMSSTVDRETLRLDPDNRWLTRFQPRRVEAEVVWDSIRAVAGTLNRKMYGLPIGPPLDQRELIGNYRKWPSSPPAEANRRAVYIVVRRSFRFPALSAFDLPENVSSCGQRDRTIVPNQALTLLNNRTIREQAGAFAERLLRETDGSPEALAARAWRYVYGRTMSDDERREVVAFLRGRNQATETWKTAVEDLCVALFNTNEFLYLP